MPACLFLSGVFGLKSVVSETSRQLKNRNDVGSIKNFGRGVIFPLKLLVPLLIYGAFFEETYKFATTPDYDSDFFLRANHIFIQPKEDF